MRERDNSDDEDYIPLMELAIRLNARNERLAEEETYQTDSSEAESGGGEETPMDCSEIKVTPQCSVQCDKSDELISDAGQDQCTDECSFWI